jgi:hypothetical protein
MAFDLNAGLDFLRSHGISVKPTATPGYVSRLAGNVERQIAAGLPASRQAARGHVRTPEHPGRRRPVIPDNPSDYSRYPSRYGVMTRPLTAYEPRLRAPISINRPAVHTRDVTMPEGMLEIPGHSLIITAYSEREALRIIRQRRANTRTIQTARGLRVIANRGPHPSGGVTWRVRIDVFDCSRRAWVSLFLNRGHAQGIDVDFLLSDFAEEGGSFEEYLIRRSIESHSGTHAMLSHICMYTMHFIPSDVGYFQLGRTG